MKAYNGTEITQENGKWYDEEGTEYQECYECGDYYPTDEMTDTVNGMVCQDCLDNEYTYCEGCNKFHRLEYMVAVFDDSWSRYPDYLCKNCAEQEAHQCCFCDRYYRDTYQITHGTYVGDHICSDCCDNQDIHECCECGGIGEDVYYCEEDNEYYCPDCMPQIPLLGYRQTKNLPWVGDYDDLHMGVELEIDKGGEWASNALTIKECLGEDYCECKEDGSLDDGFEIASSPATYEAHTTKLKWRTMMEKAIELGYRSHNTNTCGLHVHVDRAYFGCRFESEYEDKIAMLFANNVNWIRTFSRRKSFNYCEITDDMSKTTTPEQAKEKNYQSKPDKRRRYSAINYSTRINTIEFRIFKGTLNYSTFLATLQFVQMFCDFVKDLSPEALAYVGMYRFIQESKDRGFTEFTAYLKKRGLM